MTDVQCGVRLCKRWNLRSVIAWQLALYLTYDGCERRCEMVRMEMLSPPHTIAKRARTAAMPLREVNATWIVWQKPRVAGSLKDVSNMSQKVVCWGRGSGDKKLYTKNPGHLQHGAASEDFVENFVVEDGRDGQVGMRDILAIVRELRSWSRRASCAVNNACVPVT